MLKFRSFFVLPLLLILSAPSAHAVIAVKLPVSQMYDGSQTVVVGNITKINAELGGVVASAKALKGDLPGENLKFKFIGLPNVMSKLKEGAPVVLLTGQLPQAFALHIGDTWLLPEVTKIPGTYEVKQERDLRQSYPGTTAALSRIVQDRAANQYKMLDKITDEQGKAMFHGGAKDLGKFDAANFTSLQTIKALRGNRKSLVALGKDGLKFFAATDKGIASARASLPAIATADVIAISVVDLAGTGAPVIVALKKSGELNLYETPTSATPTKTIQFWKDGAIASAAAFGNFGEDEKPCVIVLKEENIERYPLDGASEPADFLRLTGERITNYQAGKPKFLATASASSLDVNGDNKTDLLINTPTGPLLLINRGYGAFFVDRDVAKVLKTAEGASLVAEKSLWTAIDIDNDGLDDLLIVNESGAASAVMNTKPEK